jgi:hypothetical protein
MHLFNIGDRFPYKSSASLSKYPRYLSHETEPVDLYRKYQDDGVTLNKELGDSNNPFDGSASRSMRWLNMAREYVRMNRF